MVGCTLLIPRRVTGRHRTHKRLPDGVTRDNDHISNQGPGTGTLKPFFKSSLMNLNLNMIVIVVTSAVVGTLFSTSPSWR